MTRDEQDAIAAEHALGTAGVNRDGHEDPALAPLVEGWERRLAPLADALAPVAPPADLLAQIEGRLFGTAPANSLTIRAGEGGWVTLGDGVEVKILWQNPVLRRESVLVRLAPGATYDSHHHPDDEECYVLEGDIAFGEHLLKAGDYHLARKGGSHALARSRTGCLLYINAAMQAA